MDLLAQMSWGLWFLAALIIAVCAILIIVILLQRGRGGGLAGAFGGGGGSAAFGAKTGDVFTWITVVMAAVFVVLAVVLNFAFDQSVRPTAATAAQPLPQPVGDTESVPITITPTEERPDWADPTGGAGAPVSSTPVSVPVTITPSGETTGEDAAGPAQPAEVDTTSGKPTADDKPPSDTRPSRDVQPSATDEQAPPEGSDEEPPER